MASFANQRTVTIHKPSYNKNFVQVDIDDWQEAYDKLTKSGFGLYLYCCGNKDDFKLELSSAAVQNALHISDSSYRRAVEELLKYGYFIPKNKTNTKYDFFTTPQPTSYVPKPKKTKKKSDGGGAAAPVLEETPAAEPIEEPTRPPYSFSPHLVRDYDWEE